MVMPKPTKVLLSLPLYHATSSHTGTGIQTSQDARFYAYTATFPKFSNKGKDLVLQYTVKHEQNIDCGGGYIKVLPSTVDQKEFNGDSQYK
jgi:hypothetical protein